MKIDYYFARCLYEGFARYLPKTSSPIKIGQKAIRGWCMRHILPYTGQKINIGRNADISRKVSIGNESSIGDRSYLQGEIHIGEFVMMGQECRIYTTNHRMDNTEIPMCHQGDDLEKPVYIGNDVWIGSRVTILPGVHIGDGAVIGASAVVTKDVPEYAVIGGNPARILNYRKVGE